MEKFVRNDLFACESDLVDMSLARFNMLEHFRDWVMERLETDDMELALKKVNSDVDLTEEYIHQFKGSYSSFIDGFVSLASIIKHGGKNARDGGKRLIAFDLEEATAAGMDIPATRVSFSVTFSEAEMSDEGEVIEQRVIVVMEQPYEHVVLDTEVEFVENESLTAIIDEMSVSVNSAFRNYTDDVVQELEELQIALNRQDNWGNANPVYWGIKDVVNHYVAAGDGHYDIVTDFDSTYKLDEFMESIIEGMISDGLDPDDYFFEDETYNIYSYLNKDEDSIGMFSLSLIVEELKSVCDNDFRINSIVSDFVDIESVSVLGVDEEFVIKESLIFLTSDEAEKHLELNAHHYSDRAFAYAMTAFRSPSVELVWEALRSTDFAYIKEALSYMD